MNSTSPSSRSGLILVVDDDDDSRDSLRDLLVVSGHTVETARNGKEALALLAERLPALILTDLRMPVMDGWELLAELRKDPRYSSVMIAVTSGEGVPPEGYRHFRKPLEPERILAFARDAVGPFDADGQEEKI